MTKFQLRAVLWTAVTLSILSCGPSGRESISTNVPSVVLVPISVEHLSTRVGSAAPIAIRLSQTNGTNDLDALSTEIMRRAEVRRGRSDEVVASTVEPKIDHWGVGFDVTWDGSLGAGWFILRLPLPRGMPDLLNANEFNTAPTGALQSYFRIGSEPLLRRITRCRRDQEYSFAVDFSEEVRAESDQIERIFEARTSLAALSCRSSAELFSTTAQDFSRPFPTLYATCAVPENDTATYEIVFSELKSPEGSKLGRPARGDAVVSVTWDEDSRVHSSGCNVWYESQLPF